MRLTWGRTILIVALTLYGIYWWGVETFGDNENHPCEVVVAETGNIPGEPSYRCAVPAK